MYVLDRVQCKTMSTPWAPVAGATLAGLMDRILGKGLVINADIQVSVIGVELLGSAPGVGRAAC